MSHLFERPLCDMGRAYDFAFRPIVGEPAVGDGGPCDDRPHRIELFAAGADRSARDADWQAFSVCPEHESQLRRYDERLRGQGRPPRFRSTLTGPPPPGGGG
ncbi:MAG TPA: hypothetical protein VEE83_03085 [Thermoplasmata archaeon]|nr:hypothetical protein [Thermoplasmata archaeon]